MREIEDIDNQIRIATEEHNKLEAVSNGLFETEKNLSNEKDLLVTSAEANLAPPRTRSAASTSSAPWPSCTRRWLARARRTSTPHEPDQISISGTSEPRYATKNAAGGVLTDKAPGRGWAGRSASTSSRASGGLPGRPPGADRMPGEAAAARSFESGSEG
jgi:hypothetical protein